MFKTEVFLHAGDIIDEFVDQDLKLRFCFVAHLRAKVSCGTGKSVLTFQAAGDPFLLIIEVGRGFGEVNDAQLSAVFCISRRDLRNLVGCSFQNARDMLYGSFGLVIYSLKENSGQIFGTRRPGWPTV